MNVFDDARQMIAKDPARNTHGNLQKYATRSALQRWLMKRYLGSVHVMIKSVDPKTMTDVGGGEGFLSTFCTQNADIRVTVIDSDEDAVRRGRAWYPTIHFICADAFTQAASQKKSDIVVCAQVLEHVEDPLLLLKKLSDMTEKYCLITVPHEPFFSLGNLCRLKNVRLLGNDPEHLHRWGISSFVRLLQMANLKVVRQKTSCPWMIFLCEKTDACGLP